MATAPPFLEFSSERRMQSPHMVLQDEYNTHGEHLNYGREQKRCRLKGPAFTKSTISKVFLSI